MPGGWGPAVHGAGRGRNPHRQRSGDGSAGHREGTAVSLAGTLPASARSGSLHSTARCCLTPKHVMAIKKPGPMDHFPSAPAC